MRVKRFLASGILATSLTMGVATPALAFDGQHEFNPRQPMVQELSRHFLRHRFRAAGEVISIDTSKNIILVKDRKDRELTLNYNEQTKFIKEDVVSDLEVSVGDQVRVKGRFDKLSQKMIAQVIKTK